METRASGRNNMVADSCKIHMQPANVKSVSDGVVLISGSVCLCESICIPCR